MVCWLSADFQWFASLALEVESEIGWLRCRPVLIYRVVIKVRLITTRCWQVLFIELLRLHHHVGRWWKTLERIERLHWNLLLHVDTPAWWGRWRWLVCSGWSTGPVFEVVADGGDVRRGWTGVSRRISTGYRFNWAEVQRPIRHKMDHFGDVLSIHALQNLEWVWRASEPAVVHRGRDDVAVACSAAAAQLSARRSRRKPSTRPTDWLGEHLRNETSESLSGTL